METRLIAMAAAFLLLAILSLRLCRERPPSAPALSLSETPPLPPPPAAAERPSMAPAKPGMPPRRLLPHLERLGRARLLRDRRTLALLARESPPVYESDIPWLLASLQSELFVAAGAAEILGTFGRHEAVPDLGRLLSGKAHPFLKDVAIDSLAYLGGDAAVAVLLGTLQGDTDASIRARAAGALGRFSGPEAYYALAAALRDPSPQVRSAASFALSRLPSKDVVQLLLRRLSEETDPEVRADLVKDMLVAGGTLPMGQLPGALIRRSRIRSQYRYEREYDPAFFEPGMPPVLLRPGGKRIGITVELGPGVSLQEVQQAIFSAAPFDRYRDWFRFRRTEEFPGEAAYDSYGNTLGNIPYDDLDGTVFLRFRDPASFDQGVLGFTQGCEAFVTPLSLRHELGHALARLGDEYPKGSTREAANLSHANPPPWALLLPDPVLREEGLFVPSDNCHMNNRTGMDSRFCPPCQLEIHARIVDLTGAPLPW